MKINFTILFTLFFSFSFSQSIIFDNINSNGGKINDENINITFTIGQPIVGTISNHQTLFLKVFNKIIKLRVVQMKMLVISTLQQMLKMWMHLPFIFSRKYNSLDSYTEWSNIHWKCGILTQHQTRLGVTLYLFELDSKLFIIFFSTSWLCVSMERVNCTRWEDSYSTINQYGCDSTANLSLTIIIVLYWSNSQ